MLSRVWLFTAPWTVAHQPSLPFNIYPGVCSNSCPSSQWCHPTISSSVIPFSFWAQYFPASVSSKESALHIRWPKYWSFNFSPSKEYGGLISFMIDWFDLALAAAAAGAKSLQSGLTLCDLIAAHQALPSLGFSRQEHWSGLPFPSPMHESENWKWSHSVMSDS